MTDEEIQKEWDAFIAYPDGSGKLYVTIKAALMFARVIAGMATDAEREACVQICVEQACRHPYPSHAGASLTFCADAIRARGQA